MSPLTGLPCQNPTERPVAVMLASDPQARPLSGLAAADMVFEMPVTPDGITRMMAVYQCGAAPKEIGSIRSARQDFIPLAQGLKAVFAHWGGEHEALARLDNHIIDNVDALIYEGTVFYRKQNIARPHNGFSTLALISGKAGTLGYAASASIAGNPHERAAVKPHTTDQVEKVSVPWPQGMDIEFHYDRATNTYARWRGGEQEIDATTGKQVTVSVVIVMGTDASFLREQYISVRTTGTGIATIYQDGRSIPAHWNKSNADAMLTFTDANGEPVSLAPGHIWVAIDAPLPSTR
jgi:hypothetical protein